MSGSAGWDEPGLGLPQFLAALDADRSAVIGRFRALGFTAEVAEATLADVPRKVAAYGDAAQNGPEVGIDVGWLQGLARADVVALGRLQFERLPVDGRHAVHVPEAGPLTDDAVDASLTAARDVLGAHAFSCRSWLLDPLLGGLGTGSGIVRFARRFEVRDVERDVAADRSVAKFVFRRPLADVLDARAVHPRTRLERLVADHLRGGGHWAGPLGLSAPA